VLVVFTRVPLIELLIIEAITGELADPPLAKATNDEENESADGNASRTVEETSTIWSPLTDEERLARLRPLSWTEGVDGNVFGPTTTSLMTACVVAFVETSVAY
jgi:hypothetical protein